MQFHQSANLLLTLIIACSLQQLLIRGAAEETAGCPFDKCTCEQQSESFLKIFCGYSRLREFPIRSSKYHPNVTKIELHLESNKLVQVPAGRLHALAEHLLIKRLDLGNNEITSVHVEAFKDLQGVEQLYLNDNRLIAIDAATFDPLRNTTQHIDLSRNKIGAIEALTFANFSKLVHLDLNSNCIESIQPDAFLHCVQLRELDLSLNYLKKIPARLFFSLVRIENIFLEWQRKNLLTIDDFAFERDTSMSAVNITLSHMQSDSKEIQLGTRSFCSLNNNTNKSLFVQINKITIKGHSQLTNSNKCLFKQLKHRRVDLEIGKIVYNCNCEPLSIEEEHRFCEKQREIDCQLMTTTTKTTKITATTTTSTIKSAGEISNTTTKAVSTGSTKTTTNATTTTILSTLTTTTTTTVTSTITSASEIITPAIPARSQTITLVASTDDITTDTTTTTTAATTTTETITHIMTTRNTQEKANKIKLVIFVYISLLLFFLICFINFFLKIIHRLIL